MEKDIEELARIAGLQAALEKFPEDVLASAREARSFIDNLFLEMSPSDEPWPPMRVRNAR